MKSSETNVIGDGANVWSRGGVVHASPTAREGVPTGGSGNAAGDGARDGAREAAGGREAPTVRPGKVLVIDDEAFIGSSLRILLAPEHDVTAVTRARDGLARIEAGEPYDAILCDLMMPDMNGTEFYRELTTRAPSLVHRIVFLTGGAFTASAQEFLERVQPPCLEKPFDVQALKAALRAVMA